MSNPPEHEQPEAVEFVPKEDLISVLASLGISRNASMRALYHTGNYSADMAAAWVFENQDRNINTPFSSSELSDVPSYKMVFVVNQDLKMSIGKTAGQVGHAAVGLYRELIENQQNFGESLLFWSQYGETKIVLKGLNADHLKELASKAKTLDLPIFEVYDAGMTEVRSGSFTVLAIMGKTEAVNVVTGSLTLL
ncbi:hypothetical protein HELRODRAFT_76253 [Helobdella robusta]|uniref:peptidyl-tRNA hydrolase n=1 Tax=Helobdella robusta TaxID=6412 RepID=T1G2H4_HELRO|nr:hypothetical protein HELRODRAFT_76253 [Helobdella robusta]ESO07541.1 hypothetical protein HELRODRAFT_76253 [Helobdella robusta]